MLIHFEEHIIIWLLKCLKKIENMAIEKMYGLLDVLFMNCVTLNICFDDEDDEILEIKRKIIN